MKGDVLVHTGELLTDLSRSSRYRGHEILDLNGVRFQETWKTPEVPIASDDKYLRLDATVQWRLDLLADAYYGDQGLWWVIALANGIVDPFAELNDYATNPVVLRIPARRTVLTKVLR